MPSLYSEVFQEFFTFCEGILSDENPKFLELIKTRYNECPEEFRHSDSMTTLLKESREKMATEKSRLFVHLKNLLTVLKGKKHQLKKSSKDKQKARDGRETKKCFISLEHVQEVMSVVCKTENVSVSLYDSSSSKKPVEYTCSLSDGHFHNADIISVANEAQLKQLSLDLRGGPDLSEIMSERRSHSFHDSPCSADSVEFTSQVKSIESYGFKNCSGRRSSISGGSFRKSSADNSSCSSDSCVREERMFRSPSFQKRHSKPSFPESVSLKKFECETDRGVEMKFVMSEIKRENEIVKQESDLEEGYGHLSACRHNFRPNKNIVKTLKSVRIRECKCADYSIQPLVCDKNMLFDNKPCRHFELNGDFKSKKSGRDENIGTNLKHSIRNDVVKGRRWCQCFPSVFQDAKSCESSPSLTRTEETGVGSSEAQEKSCAIVSQDDDDEAEKPTPTIDISDNCSRTLTNAPIANNLTSCKAQLVSSPGTAAVVTKKAVKDTENFLSESLSQPLTLPETGFHQNSSSAINEQSEIVAIPSSDRIPTGFVPASKAAMSDRQKLERDVTVDISAECGGEDESIAAVCVEKAKYSVEETFTSDNKLCKDITSVSRELEVQSDNSSVRVKTVEHTEIEGLSVSSPCEDKWDGVAENEVPSDDSPSKAECGNFTGKEISSDDNPHNNKSNDLTEKIISSDDTRCEDEIEDPVEMKEALSDDQPEPKGDDSTTGKEERRDEQPLPQEKKCRRLPVVQLTKVDGRPSPAKCAKSAFMDSLSLHGKSDKASGGKAHGKANGDYGTTGDVSKKRNLGLAKVGALSSSLSQPSTSKEFPDDAESALSEEEFQKESKNFISPADRKPTEEEKDQARIKKLEKYLKMLRDEIEKCQNQELSLDDMSAEDSSYVYEDRLQKKFVKCWAKLCELTKRTVTTGRPTEKTVRYNGTRYKEINRRLERFLNKHKIFPDFHDVKTIIKSTNKKYRLNLNANKLDQIAREAFLDIGNMLQRRRKEDLMTSVGVMGSTMGGHDPALFDPVLRQKLESNAKVAKTNLENVIEKFTEMQHGLGSDNGTSSDNKEEEEEEEEDRLSPEVEDKMLTALEDIGDNEWGVRKKKRIIESEEEDDERRGDDEEAEPKDEGGGRGGGGDTIVSLVDIEVDVASDDVIGLTGDCQNISVKQRRSSDGSRGTSPLSATTGSRERQRQNKVVDDDCDSNEDDVQIVEDNCDVWGKVKPVEQTPLANLADRDRENMTTSHSHNERPVTEDEPMEWEGAEDGPRLDWSKESRPSVMSQTSPSPIICLSDEKEEESKAAGKPTPSSDRNSVWEASPKSAVHHSSAGGPQTSQQEPGSDSKSASEAGSVLISKKRSSLNFENKFRQGGEEDMIDGHSSNKRSDPLLSVTNVVANSQNVMSNDSNSVGENSEKRTNSSCSISGKAILTVNDVESISSTNIAQSELSGGKLCSADGEKQAKGASTEVSTLKDFPTETTSDEAICVILDVRTDVAEVVWDESGDVSGKAARPCVGGNETSVDIPDPSASSSANGDDVSIVEVQSVSGEGNSLVGSSKTSPPSSSSRGQCKASEICKQQEGLGNSTIPVSLVENDKGPISNQEHSCQEKKSKFSSVNEEIIDLNGDGSPGDCVGDRVHEKSPLKSHAMTETSKKHSPVSHVVQSQSSIEILKVCSENNDRVPPLDTSLSIQPRSSVLKDSTAVLSDDEGKVGETGKRTSAFTAEDASKGGPGDGSDGENLTREKLSPQAHRISPCSDNRGKIHVSHVEGDNSFSDTSSTTRVMEGGDGDGENVEKSGSAVESRIDKIVEVEGSVSGAEEDKQTGSRAGLSTENGMFSDEFKEKGAEEEDEEDVLSCISKLCETMTRESEGEGSRGLSTDGERESDEKVNKSHSDDGENKSSGRKETARDGDVEMERSAQDVADMEYTVGVADAKNRNQPFPTIELDIAEEVAANEISPEIELDNAEGTSNGEVDSNGNGENCESKGSQRYPASDGTSSSKETSRDEVGKLLEQALHLMAKKKTVPATSNSSKHSSSHQLPVPDKAGEKTRNSKKPSAEDDDLDDLKIVQVDLPATHLPPLKPTQSVPRGSVIGRPPREMARENGHLGKHQARNALAISPAGAAKPASQSPVNWSHVQASISMGTNACGPIRYPTKQTVNSVNSVRAYKPRQTPGSSLQSLGSQVPDLAMQAAAVGGRTPNNGPGSRALGPNSRISPHPQHGSVQMNFTPVVRGRKPRSQPQTSTPLLGPRVPIPSIHQVNKGSSHSLSPNAPRYGSPSSRSMAVAMPPRARMPKTYSTNHSSRHSPYSSPTYPMSHKGRLPSQSSHHRHHHPRLTLPSRPKMGGVVTVSDDSDEDDQARPPSSQTAQSRDPKSSSVPRPKRQPDSKRKSSPGDQLIPSAASKKLKSNSEKAIVVSDSD